jgi:uncharacterized membrane-anchored protein
MIFSTKEVKNEIVERMEKILTNSEKYTKKEYETFIKKIIIDIEKREKNRESSVINDDCKIEKPKKKQLSSYNLFIKEHIPILQGTSIDRFKTASQMWNEKKEKK